MVRPCLLLKKGAVFSFRHRSCFFFFYIFLFFPLDAGAGFGFGFEQTAPGRGKVRGQAAPSLTLLDLPAFLSVVPPRTCQWSAMAACCRLSTSHHAHRHHHRLHRLRCTKLSSGLRSCRLHHALYKAYGTPQLKGSTQQSIAVSELLVDPCSDSDNANRISSRQGGSCDGSQGSQHHRVRATAVGFCRHLHTATQRLTCLD